MNPNIYPTLQQQQNQQQSQYAYQQPPPMTSNTESQPINTAPRRCPCYLRKKLFANPLKTQKIVLCVNMALSVLLCLFATGFFFVLSVLPKIVALVFGLFALKERRNVQMMWGIHIGFTMFSMLYTVALAFHDWFTFLVGMILLVGEIMSLVYGANIAKDAFQNNQSSLDVTSEDESDFVAPQTEEQEPVYNQQPVFQEVYPSQPQPPVQQYQQQPQIHYPQQPVQHFQPAPVSQPPMHSDEALFQKFAVQLSLLSEMSFSQNYQQKVRNARLLEKHNGNIQAVVAEIVQEGQ